MTVMEISESKLDNLQEIAEKMVKCGEKLLECVTELTGTYSERSYSRGRYSNRDWEEKPYYRYR